MSVLAQLRRLLAALPGQGDDQRMHLEGRDRRASWLALADLAQQSGIAQPENCFPTIAIGERRDRLTGRRPAQHPRTDQKITCRRIQHPVPQRIEQQVLRELGIQLRQHRIDDLCLLVCLAQRAWPERAVIIFPGEDRLADQRIEKLHRADGRRAG